MKFEPHQELIRKGQGIYKMDYPTERTQLSIVSKDLKMSDHGVFINSFSCTFGLKDRKFK